MCEVRASGKAHSSDSVLLVSKGGNGEHARAGVGLELR